jgi:hypothetical protein
MINWYDLILPLLAVVVVLMLVALVGWHGRKKSNRQKALAARSKERFNTFLELQEWLHDKLVHDLADSDNQTTPLIKALLQINDMSGTVDELRPIAEAYQYRKGFKNEWIGE